MADRVVSSGDWRRQQESGSRWGAIVLLGLLIVGLLVALVLYLLPPNPPNVAIHMIGYPDYSTDIPGIPFVSEDLELFQQESLPVVEGQLQKRKLKNPGEIENIASELDRFFEKGDDQDIALIYISALGVAEIRRDAESDELVAKPFLLGATSSSTAPELTSVEKLLDSIQSIKANTKVLILDTAYLGERVDLGMGVNEFVFQLHRSVAEIEDRNLWIIHSTGMLQMSQVSYREKKSVFANAVQAAFEKLGDPNRGDDIEVHLDEFYAEIVNGCLAYAPRGTSYVQTPVLLRGGTGLVVRKSGKKSKDVSASEKTLVFFRSIKSKSKDDEEEVEKEEEEEAADETAQLGNPRMPLASIKRPSIANLARLGRFATGRSQEGSSDQDESDDTGDTSTEDEDGDSDGDSEEPEEVDPLDALHAQVPLTELQQKLNRVMVLRDQLSQRTEQRTWIPIDFAPNIWDRVLMRLARLDERAMFVTPETDRTVFTRFDNELDGYQKDFERLLATLDQGRTFRGNSLNNEIAEYTQPEVQSLVSAWNRFSNSDTGQVKASWEESDPESRQIVNAIKVYHGVLLRLKYYQLLSEDLSYFVNPISFNSELAELIEEVKERKAYFSKVQFGNKRSGLVSDVSDAIAAAEALQSREQKLRDAVFTAYDEQVAGRVAIERTEYLIAERLAITFLHSPLLAMVERDPDWDRLTRIQVFNFLEGLRERPWPTIGETNPSEHWATAADFSGEGQGRWNAVSMRIRGRQQLLSLVSKSNEMTALESVDSSQFETSLESILQTVRTETFELKTNYENLLSGDVDNGAGDATDPLYRRFVSSAIPFDSKLLAATGKTIFSDDPIALRPLTFQRKVGDELVRFVDQYPPVFEMMTSEKVISTELNVNNYKSTKLEFTVDKIDSDYYEIYYRPDTEQGNEQRLSQVGDTFSVDVIDLESGRRDLQTNRVRVEFLVRTKPGVNQATLPELHDQAVPALTVSTIGLTDQATRTQCRLQVKSPLPQFLDLIVRNPVTQVWEPSNDQGRMNTRSDQDRNVFPSKTEVEIVQVHPFTGRSAPYELMLVNRSGIPVDARVELYRVRRPGAYPGLQFDAYPLLPGRVSDLNLRTPDKRLVEETTYELPSAKSRFMPAVTDENKMVPFAISQLTTLPAASQPFPSSDEVFSDDDSIRKSAKLIFGKPIGIPSSEEGEPDAQIPNDPLENVDVTEGILCRILIKGWKDDEIVEQLRWIEMTPTLWNQEDRYIDIESISYDAETRRIEAEIRPHGFAKSQTQGSRLPWEFLKAVEARWVDIDSDLYPNERFDEIATFENTTPMTRYWNVPDLGENVEVRNWPIWFDVDGYPRLFHYQLNVGDTDDPGVNWRDSAGRCEIVRLDVYNEKGLEEPSFTLDLRRAGTEGVWIGDCDSIIVHYEIDGPMGGLLTLSQQRLAAGSEEYIRTFTRDTIRQAENQEVYYLDRDINYSASVAKSGDLQIGATVADLQREFETSRLGRNTPIPFVAELNVPGTEAISKTKIIGIDARQPKLNELQFTTGSKSYELPFNQTVQVKIEGVDRESGLPDSGVELYLNLERNNVGRLIFDEGKKLEIRPSVVSLDENTGTKEWEWLIVPEDLKLKKGNYTISARVKDQVGLVSREELTIDLTVIDEVVAQDTTQGQGQGEKPAKLYDVELTVTTQRGSARLIRVDGSVDLKIEVEGPKKASAQPGERNYDRILRRLPAGTYTLTAEAVRNGKVYYLETEFTIEEDEKNSRIPLSLNLKEKPKDDD